MDVKEEVRNRLNIEEVIAEYVELRRAGRNFKALSPFSQEKTPSFIVSPDKQIWHDFSTNRGGDVFSFVMEMEGLDFRGALELLARKAGVDVKLYSNDRAKEFHQKKQRLYDAVELATKFYEFALEKSKIGSAYWRQQRGFTPEIIKRFRLGFAPRDGRSLTQFLLSRGFSAQELRDAGLLVQRSSGPGDMFRDRVMVPLADGQGRIVGFTARMLGEQKNAPKYINTPQTLLYDKGRQVFGLHLAKEAIRSQDYAVIVEGNLDVIASHQAGESAVVATAGTAMTRDHLAQLARLSPHIKLAFDSDKAGLAATERAIGIAQEIGVELSIITMPEGIKDPDELIARDSAAWGAAIVHSVYAVDWVIARHQALNDLESAEGKRTFTTKTLEVVQKLQDPVEKEHYVNKIADMIQISRGALLQKLRGFKEVIQKPLKPHQARVYQPDQTAYQDDFLALMVRYPVARDALKNLHADDLLGEERQRLAGYLIGNPDVEVSKELDSSLQQSETYVKIVLLRAEQTLANVSEDEALTIAYELAARIRQQKIKTKKQLLAQELASAERQGDSQKVETLKQQLAALIKEQKHG